jgi:SagB-type dehydrogenase family enzyme
MCRRVRSGGADHKPDGGDRAGSASASENRCVRNWDDVAPARRYHEATKHSFMSVRTSAHRLDWENRPHPFKEYRGLEPVPVPDALGLDRLLALGAGVVRTREAPGGDVYHFRTYASAGALYPVEVYLVAGDLPGLEAGVYHFHPRELALRQLRRGDFREFLGRGGRGAVLVLTGILWRTAWKYGARGYRHLFWDAGTMLANLLALAEDQRPVVHTGFVDERVNRLVGVDGRREAALALLALGRGRGPVASPDPEPIAVAAEPLSRAEASYPLAEELHAASELATQDEVDRYTGRMTYGGDIFGIDLTAGEPLERVIRRRGSARHFTLEPISASALAAILAAAVAPYTSDTPRAAELYAIANAVDGLEPGAYRYRPFVDLELVEAGEFRRTAGYLALEQAHAARAAATHFVLADLEQALAARGNRAYRALQLEAGIVAGRLYLAAYARRLGATGLTFYDDDVARFFTGGTELQPLLCVALGPSRRAQRAA